MIFRILFLSSLVFNGCKAADEKKDNKIDLYERYYFLPEIFPNHNDLEDTYLKSSCLKVKLTLVKSERNGESPLPVKLNRPYSINIEGLIKQESFNKSNSFTIFSDLECTKKSESEELVIEPSESDAAKEFSIKVDEVGLYRLRFQYEGGGQWIKMNMVEE